MMGMEIVISVILLFVGIAVLGLIHICIVGRAFTRGHSNDQDMITAPNRKSSSITKRVSSEDLKILPCFGYKALEVIEGEEEASPLDCAVCLENFDAGEECRLLLNCNHIFHSQCIDSWLLKTPLCPICRTCVLPLKVSVMLNEGSREVAVDVGVRLT